MSSHQGSFVVASLACVLLLAACSKEEKPRVADTARPVKTLRVEAPAQGGIRQFPARIDAIRKAELSFRVPGKVVKLPVAEGEDVSKGQVLAELDATDFQIVVNDRLATYTRAKKDFERARQLVKKGHIARMDYDRLEAQFKSAAAALKSARQDLSYTRLKAPFAGTVAQRYVQRFEEVQAKQPVLALSDTTSLEVKFDVPENIILGLKPEQEQRERKPVPVWASFDSVPGQRFPLTFKEAASRADPATQTFEVTFTMPRPKELTVLPGMTATVTLDLTRHLSGPEIHYLPLTALTGDDKLAPRVWVVDEKDLTVHARRVDLGPMKGTRVEVRGGIKAGERVVTAGAAYLAEGMKVRLMPSVEQAEPRPQDLKLMCGQ